MVSQMIPHTKAFDGANSERSRVAGDRSVNGCSLPSVPSEGRPGVSDNTILITGGTSSGFELPRVYRFTPSLSRGKAPIGGRYHEVSFWHCRSAADPPDADVRRGTETIRELCTVMLDVTDVHELMLQLRHAVPTETALRAVEIERVHRVIDDAIAERPVLEHLRLCIWVALDTVIV